MSFDNLFEFALGSVFVLLAVLVVMIAFPKRYARLRRTIAAVIVVVFWLDEGLDVIGLAQVHELEPFYQILQLFLVAFVYRPRIVIRAALLVAGGYLVVSLWPSGVDPLIDGPARLLRVLLQAIGVAFHFIIQPGRLSALVIYGLVAGWHGWGRRSLTGALLGAASTIGIFASVRKGYPNDRVTAAIIAGAVFCFIYAFFFIDVKSDAQTSEPAGNGSTKAA